MRKKSAKTEKLGLKYADNAHENTFKIANLNIDRELLELAKNDANFIIDSNILGKTERGKNLEILLHLFNKEEALKYLEAG